MVSQMAFRNSAVKKNWIYGEKYACTSFDVQILLDRMRMVFDKKIKGNKMLFIRRIKILKYVEHNMLTRSSSILNRTVKLNQEGVFKIYQKERVSTRKDLYSPKNFKGVLDGQKELKQGRMVKRDLATVQTYTDNFIDLLRRKGSAQITTSKVLVSGIWTSNTPLLKFKELLLIKLLTRFQRRATSIYFRKLRQIKNVISYRKRTMKAELFAYACIKRSWGKIWLISIQQDQLGHVYSYYFGRLEINRRVQTLIGVRRDRKKMMAYKELKIEEISPEDRQRNVALTKTKIEDEFTSKIEMAHKTFPDQFIKTLLRGKLGAKETKRRLLYLLFDTMFYLVADLIGRASVIRSKSGQRGRKDSLTGTIDF